MQNAKGAGHARNQRGAERRRQCAAAARRPGAGFALGVPELAAGRPVGGSQTGGRRQRLRLTAGNDAAWGNPGVDPLDLILRGPALEGGGLQSIGEILDGAKVELFRNSEIAVSSRVVALIRALGATPDAALEKLIAEWAEKQNTSILLKQFEGDAQGYCRSVLDKCGLSRFFEAAKINSYASIGVDAHSIDVYWSYCEAVDASGLLRCGREVASWFLYVLDKAPCFVSTPVQLMCNGYLFEGLSETLKAFDGADTSDPTVLEGAWNHYKDGCEYVEDDGDGGHYVAGFGSRDDFEAVFPMLLSCWMRQKPLTQGQGRRPVKRPAAKSAADKLWLALGDCLVRLTAYMKRHGLRVWADGNEMRPIWEAHALTLSEEDSDLLDQYLNLMDTGSGECSGISAEVDALLKDPVALRSFLLAACLSAAVARAIGKLSEA